MFLEHSPQFWGLGGASLYYCVLCYTCVDVGWEWKQVSSLNWSRAESSHLSKYWLSEIWVPRAESGVSFNKVFSFWQTGLVIHNDGWFYYMFRCWHFPLQYLVLKVEHLVGWYTVYNRSIWDTNHVTVVQFSGPTKPVESLWPPYKVPTHKIWLVLEEPRALVGGGSGGETQTVTCVLSSYRHSCCSVDLLFGLENIRCIFS